MVQADTDILCTVREQVDSMNKKNTFILTFIFVFIMISAIYGTGGSIVIKSSGYEANFSIYKVADENGNAESNFAGVNIDFTAIKTAEDMKNASVTILKYINDNNIPYDDSKKGMDSISFECRENGIYYLKFNKTSNVNMESFFISIPTYDNESNSYLYNAAVNAKVDKDGGGDGGNADNTETTTESEGTTSSGGGRKPSGNNDENTDRGIYPNDTDTDNDVSSIKDEDLSRGDDTGIEPVTEKEASIPQVTEYSTQYDNFVDTEVVTDSDSTVVNLPKTGGDKTVLICYYCGATACVLGIAILIINNIKRRKIV